MTTTIPTPPVPFTPFALTPAAEAPPSPRPLLPRTKAPGNDDADRVVPLGDTAYGHLLSDPRVRAYLWARLGPIQIPRATKEDLVGAVLDRLWNRRTDPDPVNNVARMLGLGRTILKGKLADYWRHKAMMNARIVDTARAPIEDATPGDRPEDQPNQVDEARPARSITPESALDAKQQLQHVNRVAASIGLTDDDVDIMTMTYAGEATYEQLAAERGTTEGALRIRIHRLQKALRESWGKRLKATLLLTILLLAMLLLYVLCALGPARNPPPAPFPDPTVHELAPLAPTATTPTPAIPTDVPTGPK